MHTSVAKKIFAVGTALATVLGTFVPMAVLAAPHAAGTNVKSSDGTIWMITSEGTRRAYTSAGAFLSYGFNSFASVVDANSDDLALPAGSFIPPQDGKIICSDRGADKGTCYLITNGQKGGFTSAAVFTGLGFSFSRATYGDVSWMSSTSNIDNTTMAHRPGVLVNNNGTVQLVGANGLLGIPDIATFNSWGYSFADVVPANTADKAMTQTGVMAARVAGQLSPSFTTGGGQGPVSGSVTASLSSDNPASATVIATQSGADLAHFTFAGTGVVTNVTLKRIGVSADASLGDVYLYDGQNRITDAASVTSGGVINFTNGSGLFTVGGTKTIRVVADLNASAGETLGVQLTGFTVSGSSAATVAVSGNTMNVATATLAGATFGSVTPATSTVDPTNDVLVWQSTLTVTQRDVNFTRMALRQTNSINSGDIRNFRLYINGTQVAQASNLDSNGYVTFVASSPVLVKSGAVFKVLADVAGGASRKITMSLRSKTDISLLDSNYNVGISVAGIPATSGELTVNDATVTVQKATDAPTANLTLGASDVSMGKWTVTAYGEPLKVDYLYFYATSSKATVTSLRNARVMINGVQYGSTATLNNSTSSPTSFSVNYTFQPGTAVSVELRADVYGPATSSLLADADTVTVHMAVPSTTNGQGTASAKTVKVPTSEPTTSTLTIGAGTMTLAKNATYGDQNTVVPQTAYKIASYNLSGNNSEDINVNSIAVDLGPVNGTTFTYQDLNNVYVVYNGTKLTTKSTVSASGNTWNLSQTLVKNGTAAVEVYADLASTVTADDSIHATTTVSGTTAVSGNAVSSSAIAGQTIAYKAGSISVALDASAAAASLVAGGQTMNVAAFKFTATNDTFNITDLTLTVASTSVVGMVKVMDGTTVVASKPGSDTVTFSGLSIPVSSNGSKVLTIAVDLGTVGSGAGTSGSNAKVTLTEAKANSSAGTQSTVTGTSVAGRDIYVVKTVPTISNASLPSTKLMGGNQTLYRFTVSAGSGTIAWDKVAFTIATSSGINLGSFTLYDETAGQNVTASGTPAYSAGVLTFTPQTEQEVTGSRTYALRATITGGVTTGGFVNTNIATVQTSFAAPTTAAAATGSFVWSDENAIPHSLTSSDWFGDYLVKNIPTDGQALNY